MKLTEPKTEAEYQQALAHIYELMDAKPGSVEEDELEQLSVLLVKYEEREFPIL